ncbi:MAG: hypothetical protein II988_01015 [Clostridia bacterium]|nr:hypothetical protein [Clostridia bacterium]
MIKRFLRLFICLSILLVIAFQQSACTIIDDMVERENQEYQKQKEFCEQYMHSIPVDEDGYEISYEQGIQTCHDSNLERTILDDGETVFDYIINVGLVLENNRERKLIGFEFLVEKSEKFRKVIDVWEVYRGEPLGARYEMLDQNANIYVCTDGVDIYYIYEEKVRSAWKNTYRGTIPPSLFKYDISEDKVLYLGFYHGDSSTPFSEFLKVIIN